MRDRSKTYIDRETGQEYTAKNRTKRQKRLARNRMRQEYYGRIFNENLGKIYGEYEGMEEYMPSYNDLLGGREWQDSELAGTQADAESIESQRDALRGLERQAQGGYSAQEAAAMQRMRMETAQQEQAQRDAVRQNYAARGMAGGGSEMAAALAAQQGGANRANQYALETQAQLQQRALAGLQAQGALASNMRGQSFNEDATRRSAVDDFNRWNLERRGAASQQQLDNRMGLAQQRSQAAAATAGAGNQRRQEEFENDQSWKTNMSEQFARHGQVITSMFGGMMGGGGGGGGEE